MGVTDKEIWAGLLAAEEAFDFTANGLLYLLLDKGLGGDRGDVGQHPFADLHRELAGGEALLGATEVTHVDVREGRLDGAVGENDGDLAAAQAEVADRN